MIKKSPKLSLIANIAIVVAGLLILGGFFATYQKTKAQSGGTACNNLDANAPGINSKIPAICEFQDVVLTNGTFNADAVWVYQEPFTPPDPNPNDEDFPLSISAGTQCFDLSNDKCDSKRHFDSLTIQSGAVLTHNAVAAGESDSTRRWKKVDLGITGELKLDDGHINVDGKGYPGGECVSYWRGECRIKHFNGYGPGGGTGIYLTENARGGSAAGSGGSWAGTGGKGYCDGRQWTCQVQEQRAGDGAAYTVVTQFAPYLPTSLDASNFTIDPVNNENGTFQFGSGGGSGRSSRAQANGGAGGGRIRISADKIIFNNLNSRISANGANGDDLQMDVDDHNAMGGGGSGGTIILNTPQLVEKWGLNEEPITGALVGGGKSSHCEKWNWAPGASWCDNNEPFSVGFPHYGQSGKVYAPQSINTFNHSNYIRAVGGYAASDPKRNNRATFAGAGGGGVVVLKGIAQDGHWNPPSKKKVTVTVEWPERTGSKSTTLSSIIYGKPVWISNDNTLVLKSAEVKNQNTSDFASGLLYTSRAIGKVEETYPYIGLWGGHRVTVVDSDDASNYYHFIYRDMVLDADRNFDNDIAGDGTNLYISATSIGKIYKFNPKMEFIRKIYIDNSNPGLEEPAWSTTLIRRAPISITTSRGSQDIYVLVADYDSNHYYIYQCNKDFGGVNGNCQQYQLDFVGPIDPNLKLNIAYADNASGDLSKLFLVASNMTGGGQSQYIARLKLGDNGNGSQILYNDGGSPYNGGSGIYVPNYSSGTGLATVNLNFRCWWPGFNLSTADRRCDDNGFYGKSLDIAVDFTSWGGSYIYITNSVPDWIQIPGPGSFYGGVGGGGITYFDGRIAF